MSEIHTTVGNAVCKCSRDPERSRVVPSDGNLFLLGILDSISVLNVIIELESTLQLKVSKDDLVPENFRTIDAMAEMCSRILATSEHTRGVSRAD